MPFGHRQSQLNGSYCRSVHPLNLLELVPTSFELLRQTRILYDSKGVVKKAIRRKRNAEVSPHIVEMTLWSAQSEITECMGKLRNGWLSRDEYLTSYAARAIAGRAETALVALNGISPVSEIVMTD